MAAVGFDPVTFPFSHVTPVGCPLWFYAVATGKGLTCLHWLVRHCLNPQEFPGKELPAKGVPTCPIK